MAIKIKYYFPKSEYCPVSWLLWKRFFAFGVLFLIYFIYYTFI